MMKSWAVMLLCLLTIGLQAAKVDTLQVLSPSMKKNVEVVVISPDKSYSQACPVIYLLHATCASPTDHREGKKAE